MKRVLIVGRDGEGLRYLAAALHSSEFVCTCRQMSDLDDTALGSADIVLLVAPLVDGAALAWCRRLQGILTVPLVLCSMSARESDIIDGFTAGVDDYLVLPMRPGELAARISALLRRSTGVASQGAEQGVLKVGDLEIDVDNRRVVRNGEAVYLSPTESRLLVALIHGNGRAVSHSRLIAAVWGPEYVDSRNYLRLYITYLRSKLEDDPHSPRLIVNEWGTGYRFNV